MSSEDDMARNVFIFDPTKIGTGYCKVRWCSRRVAKHRTVCYTCRSIQGRIQNPFSYAYRQLRQNARRRAIPFDLTKEEFASFCDKTGYLFRRGQAADSLTIDRIRVTEGYHKDNIQVLTKTENVFKGHRERAESRARIQALRYGRKYLPSLPTETRPEDPTTSDYLG